MFKYFIIFFLLIFNFFLISQNSIYAKSDWDIVQNWKKTKNGYFYFSAKNLSFSDICQKNPSFYIQFPRVIQSSMKVTINEKIIETFGDFEFKYVQSYFGQLIVPCSKLINLKGYIKWEVKSYIKDFSKLQYFPKIIKSFSLLNLFNETMHLISFGGIILLIIFYFFIFWGRISNTILFSLILSNFFTAIYFLLSTPRLVGISIPMFWNHKLSEISICLSFIFFVYFLYLQKLIPKLFHNIYQSILFISSSIILISMDGNIIQFGTTLAFPATILIIFISIIQIVKNKFNQKRDILQFISLFSFLVSFSSEIFLVIGWTNFVPIFSVGIISCYIFIILFLDDQIEKTYKERDQLEFLTQELKQKNQEIKKTQDTLIKSEKMAALGRATARIAHELNTPISSIRASSENIQTITKRFLEKIENTNLDEYKRLFKEYQNYSKELIQILISSTNRAAELVRNFKKISTDQEKGEKKEFKLMDYINESIFSMQSILKQKKLHVNLKGDNPLLYQDPSIFHQITQNMITNTIKYAYTNNTGKLDIKIKEKEENIVLSFQDYGAGIPEENISKIFDPFFTTGGGKGGTGLGLNIVYKNVISILEGEISCESKLEKGTKFTIFFNKRKGNE